VAPERAGVPAHVNSIDALKGLAWTLIIWHHLAAYGPMSDVVQLAAPGVIGWLYHYARMAVQVFLVVGSFLFASATLAKLHPVL
jgi:peptidoglycan/LPS O-acetylase OafA/YrhL